MPKAQRAKEIMKIKQDLEWHFISAYLSFIHSCRVICDKRFQELFTALEDYTNSHIEPPDGLDVIDEYVVTECKKENLPHCSLPQSLTSKAQAVPEVAVVLTVDEKR